MMIEVAASDPPTSSEEQTLPNQILLAVSLYLIFILLYISSLYME